MVVGVDAGGTFTRAMCVATDGSVLGQAIAGGGSPAHNADARQNIRTAIECALGDAGCGTNDVVALVAGIAGLDRESDAGWAKEFIAVPGVRGPRVAVNDTEVAHAGAFGGGPGIIAIAGTGSMIFGVTETGERVRNDQYMHYAGAARHLSFDVVQQLLLEVSVADSALLHAALGHWRVRDIDALRKAVRAETAGDHDEMKRNFGAFAPVITGLAAHSAVARSAIARLAESTRVGIELLAIDFDDATVPVVLEGGLARSRPFTDTLHDAFSAAGSRCALVSPQASPVEGAALLACRAVLNGAVEGRDARLERQVRRA